jgi:hypothetical protein
MARSAGALLAGLVQLAPFGKLSTGGFMTTTNPITPSPELVQQWRNGGPSYAIANNAYEHYIATQAAQWGADQELKACCTAIDEVPGGWADSRHLRHVRRPKPPSLKEQALVALQFVDEKLDLPLHNHCNAIHTIRRALEALDD